MGAKKQAKKQAKKAAKQTARIVEQLVLQKRAELLGKGFTSAEVSKQLTSPGEIAAMEAEAAGLRMVAAQVRKGSTPAAIDARAKVAEYVRANSLATPFGNVLKGPVGHVNAVDRLIKVNAAKDEVSAALKARDTAQNPAAAATADARILEARESLRKVESSARLAAGIDRLQKARGEPQYLATQRADPTYVAPLPDHMKTSHPDNEHSDFLMRGGRR